MLLPDLQSLGLSHNESELYELLLRLGETPIQAIQKETKLKRPTLYKTLYGLEAKKLVTSRDIHKKIHFRPVPPTELFGKTEQQLQSIQTTYDSLKAIMPSLTSSYTLSVEKPIVSLFEGVEGLKKIYEDSLNEGATIYALLQTAEVDPELYKWLTGPYVKQRVKLNIPTEVIVASGKWSDEYRKNDEKELRISVAVPSIQFPIQHELLIYGNKVAFVNYKKGEALIGVLISHPNIAKTMKAFFDLAWLGANTVKLKLN